MLGGPNTAQDSPAERGWYVRPTLFIDATNDMRIAREEIFGPVLTVLRYRDEEDAMRIANESDYGLAGSVWTADVASRPGGRRQVCAPGLTASTCTRSISAARSAASSIRASAASSDRRVSTSTSSFRR